MPTITVQTAQGPKRVTVDDGATQAQIEEVADMVAEQYARREPARPQEPVVGGAGEMTGTIDMDTARGIAAGAGEALQRGIGAAKQAAGNFADVFTEFVYGTPAVNSPRTPVDPANSRGRRATIAELERRTVAKELAAQAGVPTKLRDGAAAVFSAAPWAAAGLVGPMARAETMGGAVLKNSVLAAGEASLQFDADGSRLDDVLGATGLTAGVTAASAALPAGANKVVQSVKTITEGSRAEAAYQQAVAEIGPFFVSLGQRTGIPFIRALESQGFDSQLQEFYAKQAEGIVTRTAELLRQPALSPSSSLDGAFLAARSKMEGNISGLRQARNQIWVDGANQLKLKAGQGTGYNLLPAGNFRRTAAAIISDARNPLRNITRDILPRRVAATLEGVTGKAGPMRVTDAADLLIGINKLTGSGDPQQVALGSRLKDAIYKDLEAVDPQMYSKEAADAVLKMRDDYARGSALIVGLQDSVTYRMLGLSPTVDAAPVEPQAMLDAFAGLEPVRQNEVRKWMVRNSPETLLQMRQSLVDSAVRRAGTIGPASEAQIDLEKFANALTAPKEGNAIRGLNLFTPGEQNRLNGIKRALTILKNVAEPNAGKARAPVGLDDVAGVAVSLSPTFFARNIGRILTGNKSSEFLTDPEAYAKLTTYVNTRAGTFSRLEQDGARLALAEYLQDNYPPDEETPK